MGWATRVVVVVVLGLVACGGEEPEVEEAARLLWATIPAETREVDWRVDVTDDAVVLATDYESDIRVGDDWLQAQNDRKIAVIITSRGGIPLVLGATGDEANETIGGVSFAADGEIVLAWTRRRTARIISKLDRDGVPTWTTELQGEDEPWIGLELAVAADGGVYVAGQFDEPLTVGDTVLEKVGSEHDLFIARLRGEDGSVDWVRHVGNDYWYPSENIVDVAAGPNGEVVVAGNYRGPMDFGGGDVDSSFATRDGFAAVYEASGELRWAVRLGGRSDWDEATAVTFDAAGDVVVAGGFRDLIDIGDEQVESSEPAGWVARLTGDRGDVLWARPFGELSAPSVASLAPFDGGIAVAGRVQRVEHFPVTRGTAAEGDAAFLLKYSLDGEMLGSTVATGRRQHDRSFLDMASDGEVLVVTGWFEERVELGTVTLAFAGRNPLLSMFEPVLEAP